MGRIGTLDIKINVAGQTDAKKELNDFSNSGHMSLRKVFDAVNSVRWAFVSLKFVIDALLIPFKVTFAVAKAGFSILKNIINVSVIAPLKIATASVTALSATFLGLSSAVAVSSLTAFSSLEQEMINVRKTTNVTVEEMNNLKEEILDISLKSPTAATNLGKIAAAAGQLGIRGKENILGFVETIDMISIATDVTAAQAANTFGRMVKMMGLENTKENFMGMGDVINELSNTTAASASDIINGLSNVGNTAKVLGVTFEQQAALVASAISTGFLPPKRAGTSLRRFFEQIVSKTEEVGDIMGITSTEVKKRISEDAVGFMKKFLESVRGSGNQAEILAQMMEINGARAAQAANAFLSNWGDVETALEISNQQWTEGGSLIREYQFQLESLNSQFSLTKNFLFALKDAIGAAMSDDFVVMLKKIRSSLELLIIPAEDLFGFMSSELSGFVLPLIDRFNDSISDSGSVFNKLVSSSKAFFSAILSFAGVGMDIFASFGTGLVEGFRPLDSINRLTETFFGWWEEKSPLILATIGAIGTNIGTLFSKFSEGFGGFFKGLDIESILTNINDSLLMFHSTLKTDSISSYFESIGSLFNSIATKITDFIASLSSMNDAGETNFESFLGSLTKTFEDVQSVIDGINVENFSEKFDGVLIALSETIPEAFETIASVIDNLLTEEVIENLTALINVAGSAAKFVSGGVIGAISGEAEPSKEKGFATSTGEVTGAVLRKGVTSPGMPGTIAKLVVDSITVANQQVDNSRQETDTANSDS